MRTWRFEGKLEFIDSVIRVQDELIRLRNLFIVTATTCDSRSYGSSGTVSLVTSALR